MQFKVIEFNKESKRIILSHSRIYEDAQRAEAKEAKKNTSNAKKGAKKEEAPVIQNQAAATTLGDIDALAALKAQMEKGEYPIFLNWKKYERKGDDYFSSPFFYVFLYNVTQIRKAWKSLN